MATFAAELRRYMDGRGVGVRKLGQAAGLDHSVIAKVLRGDRVPSMAFAAATIEALELPKAQARRLLLLAVAEHLPEERREWLRGLVK